MSTKGVRLLAAVMAWSGSSLALALDKGAYAGASVGYSKARQLESCSDLSSPFISNFVCSQNDTAVGWKVFGGYQVNKSVAVEASYMDLGTFKTDISGQSPGPFSASEKIQVTGFGADLVLSAPVSDAFSLSVRGGVLRWAIKDTVSVSNPFFIPGLAGSDQNVHGYSATLGVGARYDFAGHLALRLDVQRFFKVGNENSTGQSDLDEVSASLIYRFR